MDDIIDTISVGEGRAFLVTWEYTDVYADILENLGIDEDDWDDYVFIEGLTNGGVKGDGIATLRQSITRGKELGHVLIFMMSDKDQDRLRQWYLSTGLFKPTRLLNVLEAD